MIKKTGLLIAIILVGLLAACVRPQTSMPDQMWVPPANSASATSIPAGSSPATNFAPATDGRATTPAPVSTFPPGASQANPTPDFPHAVPTLRANTAHYTVVAGDSLAVIAGQYQVDVATIATANGIANPDLLKVGQALVIPPPSPKMTAPSFKIIPDSELVFSPTTKDFNLVDFIQSRGGYLATYQEKVDDITMSGAQIVDLVSREHSVNPRILLAVLEFQGGWVLSQHPESQYLDYPMGFYDHSRQGLYKQLFWAANMLDAGFYGWQQNQFAAWALVDGTIVRVEPTVNSGTAAVQFLMGLLRGADTWPNAVTKNGVFITYNHLFGNPFGYSFSPLVPENLTQPELQLPFESGVQWYFTGGPHMGWDSGSPWAALDFAPEDVSYCNVSTAWEVAVADGVIVRSGDGSVVLDLDGDGYEQTGWTILYLHVATQDRIADGTRVKTGDRIGHPSCEGGYAPATHLHIARRYNGEWILADGPTPFVMDGWVAQSTGQEYDGYLNKDGQVIEAWDGKRDENKISR
jgi:LasA protease